jgi:hypothetical protein
LSVADVSVPAAPAMLVFVLAAAVANTAFVAVKFASVVTAAVATVVADVAVEAFAVTTDCTETRSFTVLTVEVTPVTVMVEAKALVAAVLASNEVASEADAEVAVEVAVDASVEALV